MPQLKPFLVAGTLALLCEGCTMAEVDKGLYAMADTVTETDRITGERSLSLADREQQIRKANPEIEKLIAWAEANDFALNERLDAEAYARLQRIFGRIHAVSHFADEHWKIILIPDDDFNAFVNGGTYVVVHYGMMKQAQSDDEIATVIGHEMGHVAANHTFEDQAHRLAMRVADVGAAGKEGYAQSFNNLQEQEADRIGVLYTALAGYDPHAASRLWGRMAVRSGREWPYFRTHPVSDERAVQTKAAADAAVAYYTPGQQNPDRGELLACNALWCKSDEQAKPGEGAGFAAILGAGVNAYLAHMEAEAERDRQKEQIERQRSDPSGQVAMPAMAPSTVFVGSDYRGYYTYQGSDVRYPMVTRFSKTATGATVGQYWYQDHRGVHEGRLAFVGRAQSGAVVFAWQDRDAIGALVATFAPDGRSLTGVWGDRDSTEPSGQWVGQMQ